jgi:hypothetical protein
VTIDWDEGTYTAVLSPEGAVEIWVDRFSFVAEGRWTGTEIAVWSPLLAEAVRVELSRRLAAVKP